MGRSGHCRRGRVLWCGESKERGEVGAISQLRFQEQADTRARTRMTRDTWKEKKKHKDRRSNAHRLESGVCGDIKCGAFKIRAVRDTHG